MRINCFLCKQLAEPGYEKMGNVGIIKFLSFCYSCVTAPAGFFKRWNAETIVKSMVSGYQRLQTPAWFMFEKRISHQNFFLLVADEFSKNNFSKKKYRVCRNYIIQRGKGIQDYSHSFSTQCAYLKVWNNRIKKYFRNRLSPERLSGQKRPS